MAEQFPQTNTPNTTPPPVAVHNQVTLPVPVQEVTTPPMEHVLRIIDTPVVAISGIRTWMSSKRMERAGNRMENLDHKIAFYGHIGQTALGGGNVQPITHNGETPKPRTHGERSFAKRVDKISGKQLNQNLYRIREVRNSGGARSETHGLRATVATAKRRHLVNKDFRNNRITASERNIQLLSAKSHPDKTQHFETLGQKRTRKHLNRATKRVEKLVSHPISDVLRKARQIGAMDDIKKHHARAEQFAKIQQEARERIAERKTAPKQPRKTRALKRLEKQQRELDEAANRP